MTAGGNAPDTLARHFESLYGSRPDMASRCSLFAATHRALLRVAVADRERCHQLELRREAHRFDILLKALGLAILRLEEHGLGAAVNEIFDVISYKTVTS